MSILVIGAGELGTAVLEALSNHPRRQGGKISVLLRPETISSTAPSKKTTVDYIKALGVGIENGDFIKSPLPDLINIFKEYDVVIQCSGYGLPTGTQIRVTEAALEAGVSRYFPWQFGVDYEEIGEGSAQDLFDEMLKVRKILRGQSKTQWTIISTGLFMSFLFMSAFGPVDFGSRIVRALGGWNNRVTITTPKDIGIMTAEMVYFPEDTDNRVIYIGGDTITYSQLASLLDRTYPNTFKREVWDMPYLKSKLEKNPNDLMSKYQNIFGEGVGVAWDQKETLNYQRNISLTDVASYVEKNRENLAGQS